MTNLRGLESCRTHSLTIMWRSCRTTTILSNQVTKGSDLLKVFIGCDTETIALTIFNEYFLYIYVHFNCPGRTLSADAIIQYLAILMCLNNNLLHVCVCSFMLKEIYYELLIILTHHVSMALHAIKWSLSHIHAIISSHIINTFLSPDHNNLTQKL